MYYDKIRRVFLPTLEEIDGKNSDFDCMICNANYQANISFLIQPNIKDKDLPCPVSSMDLSSTDMSTGDSFRNSEEEELTASTLPESLKAAVLEVTLVEGVGLVDAVEVIFGDTRGFIVITKIKQKSLKYFQNFHKV